MNQQQLGTYDSIALNLIRPSTTNPRKHFDPAALAELTASIAAIGVTQPVLLRPWPKTVPLDPPSATVNFEIVCGERRYRAAMAAGLDRIPAFFRTLSDTEAREQQMVENLQRADLHPIEEAEGYRELLKAGEGWRHLDEDEQQTFTVEDVAKRVGKTVAYVQQRLRLLSLELPAKLLFEHAHLTLGHALLLARLTIADQDAAVRNLLGANHLPKKEDMVAYVTKEIKNHITKRWRLVKDTEAELREWIRTHVLLDLGKAPWSLEDAKLVPAAGACTTCPKRTGSNVALFADITADEDVCLDASCFATKQKAIQQVTIKAAESAGKPLIRLSAKSGHQPIGDLTPGKTVVKQGQWVPAKNNSCPSVSKGILVDEPNRYDALKHKPGDVITVCANQYCTVHKHAVEEALRNVSASGSPGKKALTWEERNMLNKAWERREYVIRESLYRELRAQAVRNEPLGTLLMMVVDGVVTQSINYSRNGEICALWGWTAATFGAVDEDGDFEDDDEEGDTEDDDSVRLSEPQKKVRAKLQELKDFDLRLLLFDIVNIGVCIPGYGGRENETRDRKPLWNLARKYGVDADSALKAFQEEHPELFPELAPPPKPVVDDGKKDGKQKLSAAAQATRKATAAKKKGFNSKAAARKVAESDAPAAASNRTRPSAYVDGKSAGAGAGKEVVL